MDSLQGKVKKTAAQRSLEALVEAGQITCKEFGKNKAYFPDQSQIEVPDKEEIESIIQGIADAEKRVAEMEAQRKALEQGFASLIHHFDDLYLLSSTENARLSSELTDDELEKEIIRLTEEVLFF